SYRPPVFRLRPRPAPRPPLFPYTTLFRSPGTLDQLLRVVAGFFIFGSAIFGTLLATYTGVLIGATAIPAWFLHRTLLPIHFGTADRKSTRLNSSHEWISYAVFCLKKKTTR